ncbi:FkbM family methyltransferase [Bradyrhizobium sp.]|uniref:FkbM family methyltransferase n=1 Tax=Bradyrhizobium sp. TaxID=376 RepID=UPI002DDCF2BB|nr:FkbM family methyltransferase [Bradyrhizobium sp.]HEV2159856.1 FkbM family methyltransferase [Bradyrhizobium sp.]
MKNPLRRLNQMLTRIRQEPDKIRFLLSRALWVTGLCRFITFGFPAGYRMRFYPSSMSAGLWRNRNFRTEDADFVAAYLQPGETFVDVGANVGQLSLAAAMRVTGSGRVIAIEAHPRICKYLLGNVRLNGFAIEVHNTAIGSTDGEIVFTDFRSDDMNFACANPPPGSAALRVPVRPLDSIIGNRTVDLLKVDVEGFEVDLLKGAVKTISNCRCLYIEDSELNLRRAGTSRAELYCRLIDHGFELFHLRAGQLERASPDIPGPDDDNLIAVRQPALLDLLARTGLRLAQSTARWPVDSRLRSERLA